MKTTWPLVFFGLMSCLAHAQLPAVIKLDWPDPTFNSKDHLTVTQTADGVSLSFIDGKSHYIDYLEITPERTLTGQLTVDAGLATTIGGPGRDQDFPFIVKGSAQNLKIKLNSGSIKRVLIHTRPKVYSSYQDLSVDQRQALSIEELSAKISSLVHEFAVLSHGTPYAHDVFSRFLKPLKEAAHQVEAAIEGVNPRKRLMNDKDKILLLLTAIEGATILFESDIMLLDKRYEALARDLASIKLDIVHKVPADS